MCHLVHEVYSFSTSVLGCAVMYLLISLEMMDDCESILAIFKSILIIFFSTVVVAHITPVIRVCIHFFSFFKKM